MRRVVMPGTALETSALGYGCAHLMGRLGRRASLRKLELAFEHGITHFDVARSYGYGEAERVVGEFAAGHRDAVTITTKLGIAAPRPSRLRSTAKSVARRVAGRSERIRGLVRRRAGEAISAGHFDAAAASASLDVSLRELGTDHVDVLLLHECSPSDLDRDELLDFLEGRVRAGTVRHFGVATRFGDTLEIVRGRPAYARVVQIPSSVVERNVERLPDARPVFTHSAIAAGIDELAPRAAAWSDEIGADLGDRAALARLMLSYALRANPDGVVLFGSQSDDHVRAAAGAEDEFTPAQVDRFAELVAA